MQKASKSYILLEGGYYSLQVAACVLAGGQGTRLGFVFGSVSCIMCKHTILPGLLLTSNQLTFQQCLWPASFSTHSV